MCHSIYTKNVHSVAAASYSPAVGAAATGVASYERRGLSHASGGWADTFLCVGAWNRAGTGGNQKALRVVLTPAAAKVATARVTEAPPLEPAHQALGNHFVKTLPMLLGNEDPDKHDVFRVNLRLDLEKKSSTAEKMCCSSQIGAPTVLTVKRSFTDSYIRTHTQMKVASEHHRSHKMSQRWKCSSCRMHLIGSEIVQLPLSHGRSSDEWLVQQ